MTCVNVNGSNGYGINKKECIRYKIFHTFIVENIINELLRESHLTTNVPFIKVDS